MSTGGAFRIDQREVDERSFYAAACDPQRSVVVEACAGAGKTWMLVSRILRALLDGAEPQQILAMTFTRKAAGEMRERLDQWLAEYAGHACDDERRVAALMQRGLGAAQARGLAPQLATLQQRLLQGGRTVEVRTFHSWFTQLVMNAPLELLLRLGLPTRMQFIEETESLRGALFAAFHAAVHADASLREDYTVLVERHRRSLVQEWLDTAWQRSAELASADEAGVLEQGPPAAAALFPECAEVEDPRGLLGREPLRGLFAALAQQLQPGGAVAAKAAAQIVDGLEQADTDAGRARAWQAILGALYTQKGERRQRLDAGGALLDQACAALERLQDALAQQQGHDDHRRMARLARVLLAEFAALKRRLGLVDMTDLERAALVLLSDAALAGWLQERLDARIRHVLIDEFQDTSPLQWHALSGWLSAYAGAGGGASGQRPPSLFIVGDPKQSIYRFRRAEPLVFEAAKEFVVDGLSGAVLGCDHTRRNAQQVIDAVNPVFADAASADGWQAFRAHTTAADAAGMVRALPSVAREARAAKAEPSPVWRPSLTQPRREAEEQLRMHEARHVARGIAELLASERLGPGDVMVLARKRDGLRFIAQALAECRIPSVMPEALMLDASPEALDLVALLDALASPAHDLALARALRSPLFSASDDDLLVLAAAARDSGCRWLDALQLLADEAAPGLARARRLLRGWLAAAARLSPHDLLDRVVHEGEVVERFVAAVPPPRQQLARDAVDALLAAAINEHGGRYATLYGFVRALRSGRLQARPATPRDAVQLLTVHGAKGLEAPAVFVVDTDAQPRADERGTLLVDWPVRSPVPCGVAFVAREARVPPSLRAAMQAERQARAREELNALYVAMTRARRWLVFSRTEPRATSGARSWWERVEAQAQHWQPAGGPAAAQDATVVRVPAPASPRRPAPAPAVMAAEAAPPQARLALMGRAVHRLLEWLARSAPSSDPQRWPQWALQAVAAQGLPPSTASEVLQLARAVLDNPDCRRFFDPAQVAWAGNEVTLAWQGRSLRVDRLVELHRTSGQPVWWVLDYKLASDPREVVAYREQMLEYLAAVGALLPEAQVRGAFITAAGVLQEL